MNVIRAIVEWIPVWRHSEDIEHGWLNVDTDNTNTNQCLTVVVDDEE